MTKFEQQYDQESQHMVSALFLHLLLLQNNESSGNSLFSLKLVSAKKIENKKPMRMIITKEKRLSFEK